MGKRGPCCHCGIERTPLWRNGPPEKPILCNACGSRYRQKGTLVNYTPKHILDLLPLKKKTKYKKKKTKYKKKKKRKPFLNSSTFPHEFGDFKAEENISSSTFFSTTFEDCVNNDSSSESTTSCSETYFQIEQEDGIHQILEGQVQPSFLDFHIPSRKRSLVEYHSLSTIERLQRDLHKILKHQDPSIVLSESQEDLLLCNVNNQNIAPSEIGLGIILLKKPSMTCAK